MVPKLFGSSSKKQPTDSSSTAAGYQSPVPGQLRSSSPNYQQQQFPPQGHQGSTRPSPLDRSPSLRQGPTRPIPRHPIDPSTIGSPQPIDPGSFEQLHVLQQARNSAYLNSTNFPLPSPPLAQSHQEPKEKRGLRDKLGFGHSSRASQDAGRVSRSLSVNRKKDTRDTEQLYTEGQHIDSRSPYSRGNSSSNLLVPHAEEEEDNQQYKGYGGQKQQYGGPLPVPRKDDGYEPQYSQQPAPPQAYYQDSRSVGSKEQGLQLQTGDSDLTSSSGGDQDFHFQQDSSQSSREHYQVYQEDDLLTTPYQASLEESGRYPSNQQPPGYAQHARGGSSQPQQQIYQQPAQGRASVERYRSSSQPRYQGSIHESRPDSQNLLFLTAPSRVGNHDNPPSPLATGPGFATQQHEPHPPPSPQPPSTAGSAQSSLESMPQGIQSRGNTIRSVGEKSTGARDNPGMQAPPPPPHKEGLPAYGANSVPSGSQGAALRFQGDARGPLEGRESPAMKGPIQQAPVELVDEEASALLQLQKEHKELREKYQKVKKYYFEKEAQVHQLQNSLAHQRLSQSRTSLDDSEYATRFTRLEGLIAQLSFSIRKNWKAIPDFLCRGVNKDALSTGKQEMTAVGRAYMSHWLVSNLFDMYFHPSLELVLSRDLKEIYTSVRRSCPPFQSNEEEDALTSKLVNWRMTTVEGLQDRLRSPEAAQHHERLLNQLNIKMVGDLSLLLADPAPPDLAGGISMITELAVNIAQHIPMESRDVTVEYFYPGTLILPEYMKVETGIPALTTPITLTETSPSSIGTSDVAERASIQSNDTRDGTAAEQRDSMDGQGGTQGREEKKRGMFGGLMGSTTANKLAKATQSTSSATSAGGNKNASGREPKDEKVRMAVGICVQIRGRAVLTKAPVYSMPS